jgi:hypothetical protein
MYSGNKYLSYPADDLLAKNNNRISGGFPHSDIHGSKPIPGSPWLNAGYHVLHRLLLPRHPPNALFALDLTQKEQGRIQAMTRPSSWTEVVLTHACNERPVASKGLGQSPHTVSVLDLETISFLARWPGRSILGSAKRY